MGVDYVISYGCVPKEAFTTEGLLERVKAGERVDTVREFYRREGDSRDEAEMGFEMIRRTSEGDQETEILRLEDLRALRDELNDYEHHCAGCPANVMGRPFGCIGNVNYPISLPAEMWMLRQLPTPDEPVPFLLLQKGEEMGNTGAMAVPLRQNSPGVFFESADSLARKYDELQVTGEQLFELLFLLGTIPPKRAVMILLFLNGIPRDASGNEIMNLTPAPEDAEERFPFLPTPENSDDRSISDIKRFLRVLHRAVMQDRDVWLDV